MSQLDNYIKSRIGLQSFTRPLSKEETGDMPLYLKGTFNLQGGNIDGRSVLWAEVHKGAEVTPGGLQKQGGNLRNLFHRPVIFVFNELEAWQRKRLIEKRVAFIQPEKQLYIPEMFIDLNDAGNKNRQEPRQRQLLSYPSQCALLYHLQKESLEGKPFGLIGDLLNYSAMTASRIVKEFTGLSLAKAEGGKEKQLVFLQKGIDLWNQAFPFFSTPVKEIWFCDIYPLHMPLLKSGDLALSEYSMLLQSGRDTYAIGKEEFKSFRSANELPGLNKQYGDIKIEVWHYDPLLLSKPGGKSVDKLSLYLALGKQSDERASSALNELLISVEW